MKYPTLVLTIILCYLGIVCILSCETLANPEPMCMLNESLAELTNATENLYHDIYEMISVSLNEELQALVSLLTSPITYLFNKLIEGIDRINQNIETIRELHRLRQNMLGMRLGPQRLRDLEAQSPVVLSFRGRSRTVRWMTEAARSSYFSRNASPSQLILNLHFDDLFYAIMPNETIVGMR